MTRIMCLFLELQNHAYCALVRPRMSLDHDNVGTKAQIQKVRRSVEIKGLGNDIVQRPLMAGVFCVGNTELTPKQTT